MTYRAIGLMSGSSLDGLDIVFAEFHFQAGKWDYEILAAACYPYTREWANQLREATSLPSGDYLLLHTRYGHYLGEQVNRFIEEHNLHYQPSLIASHGHTTFHMPHLGMTAQLGDGAAIAAKTGLPVVSDLRALDMAFGGQGAPVVPVAEKLLFPGYPLFLNIGGIANISFSVEGEYTAFDICPANRVLDMIAAKTGREYDAGGQLASMGNMYHPLLDRLNALEYYRAEWPKSLPNSFGVEIVYPLIRSFGLTHPDELSTMCEHIAMQIGHAISAAGAKLTTTGDFSQDGKPAKMLITGGGAFNSHLVGRIAEHIASSGIQPEVPGATLVNYKEALAMALIGVLRWRQENNVFASVTGATRDSIGGALWTGQEA